MRDRCDMIDDINILYNEIDRFKCLSDNKIRVGKWIADKYCSECEWDKKEAEYTSGWKENFCPNCGTKMEKTE